MKHFVLTTIKHGRSFAIFTLARLDNDDSIFLWLAVVILKDFFITKIVEEWQTKVMSEDVSPGKNNPNAKFVIQMSKYKPWALVFWLYIVIQNVK